MPHLRNAGSDQQSAAEVRALTEFSTEQTCAVATAMNGPDFICIGMPKAGTGWLYDQLSHHPDFWMPPGKELHYLDRDFPDAKEAQRLLANWVQTRRHGRRVGLTRGKRERVFLRDLVSCVGEPMDIDRYAGLFRHKGNLLSGDITPGYGRLDDDIIGRLAARLPETKILLLVREPISRAWSRICMAERDGQFDVALLDDPAKFADFIRRSRYISPFFATRIIRQWSRYYPLGTQFRVILFDDIVQRPAETLRDILTFLGANPAKVSTLPADHNRKSRFRKIPMPDPIRTVLVEYLGEEVRACAELFGGAARAWLAVLPPPDSKPPATRSIRALRGQVARIRDLIGIRWKSVSDILRISAARVVRYVAPFFQPKTPEKGMDHAHRLREMAEWYRGSAKVGNDEDRQWRIEFAEHLERRANELEQAQGSADA